ncbi:LAME_0F00408g1_1 [Lachancea meyersii CBS 8951]|uniref:LAME_0F00408g1_1 n=1 Tax=Lachancea meyersii CBS 8951 TaxID=1266667 RepID=A0A1G4JPP7_9SACH|nr:LAME_0F00408g1_1 [Lachancea meyersii CBS 8951]
MTSIENLPEIGYAFLKTYYQRMHQDPSKVHHLYSTTAEVTHVNYQSEWNTNDEQLPTVKLIGKENISKFYTRHSKKVRSIQVKIDTCDFQSAGANNSSILILAVGEMCWSNTPSFRFCQSFLLAPVPSNPKIYDLTNDILHFIPQPLLELGRLTTERTEDTTSKQAAENTKAPENKEQETLVEAPIAQKPQEQEVKGADKKSEQSKLVTVEVPAKSSKNTESEKEASRTEHKKPEPALKTAIEELNIKEFPEKLEDSSAANGKLPQQSGEDETVTESKEAVFSISNETTNDETLETTNNKTVETERPSTPEPAKKMNWASKLAASESKDVPNVVTKYIRAEPDAAQPPKKISDRKSVSPSGIPREGREGKNLKKKQFNFVNKDGYYPVYVKGTGGVTDDQLVRALESEFGVVRKISSQETFAVVDFEDQRCQTEAIEKGTLKVNNVEVHMEPKTIRKSSPFSAAASTPASGQRFSKKHVNKKKA